MARRRRFTTTSPSPRSRRSPTWAAFLTTKAWYTDESDPFHRAPSVDDLRPREQRDRAAGHARVGRRAVGRRRRRRVARRDDEGVRPAEQSRESTSSPQFVDKVIWGRLQYSEGPRMYGVKKSLFYLRARPCCRTTRTSQATGRHGRRGTSSGRSGRSRLRLPARRRGVLVDVPARAQPSGSR